MAEVRWTRQARADLRNIREFLAREAPGYAEVTEDRLLGATHRLETFPLSGRIVPEIGDGAVREVIHRGYRIIYVVVDADRVDILTVFHSALPLGGRDVS
ncbi:MAG TPA: type II toxin-antitoxin system RelE/ParE family toxin [Rhodothermales bacterium]|nr:type II toxin-antitoxin system RelE/ParE family toxin [Rhodothermales bacterium]